MNKDFIKETAYLFSIPKFSDGMGKVIDVGATYVIYNESKTEVEADCIALSNDWKAVGKDILISLEKNVPKK